MKDGGNLSLKIRMNKYKREIIKINEQKQHRLLGIIISMPDEQGNCQLCLGSCTSASFARQGSILW